MGLYTLTQKDSCKKSTICLEDNIKEYRKCLVLGQVHLKKVDLGSAKSSQHLVFGGVAVVDDHVIVRALLMGLNLEFDESLKQGLILYNFTDP